MTGYDGQCSALNVSDLRRCGETATSLNGLFCAFHSKQCQGLYRGYKNRNAQLEELNKNPPRYIAKSATAIANQTFSDIDSENVLHEVFDYLLKKHALLDRVIRARKLHHSRFFSLNLDYGHQHYLDTLSNQNFIVLKAMERLGRRTAEILHKKRKWFRWVRECQDTEDAHRDSEKKKVKQEAAMFKRHQKDMEMRQNELKAKEYARRQETDLETAFLERMSLKELEEKEAVWDPIEDVMEDERGTYLDLIKHFLFMTDDSQSQNPTTLALSDTATPDRKNQPQSDALADRNKSSKSKKSIKKGGAQESGKVLPDKSLQEDRSQICQRLKDGASINYGEGSHILGTVDTPIMLKDKTAPLPDEDIDRLLGEVTEVKLLLFCRMLLSHSSLTKHAIDADSVQEFLDNKDITDADLRDICLKMEKPGLQEIRDACADLGRREEEGEANNGADFAEESEINSADESEKNYERNHRANKLIKGRKRRMAKAWSSEREKAIMQKEDPVTSSMRNDAGKEAKSTFIDFGEIGEEGNFRSKKVRVKICGKYIYNYASERAVSRSGWLQFSIIAKDSELRDAIHLCRHWDEFWELSILAAWQYFPTANWLLWKGDRPRQQLLQMGFIPYFQFEGAANATHSRQTGSRGQHRRAHAIIEYRNFMCGHIRRNDPISRRFLQYISMQTHKVAVLVRDAKTGRIVYEPPPLAGPDNESNTWLTREKSGLGRASKNEWNILNEVGPKFFTQMEEHRGWHFGFNDHYDVYIWDLVPGEIFQTLYNTIHDLLIKAHRACNLHDLFKPCEPILKSLTRDPITCRTRDIRPGENVQSLWHLVMSGTTYFVDRSQGNLVADNQHEEIFYQEADALEDTILFPEHPGSKALYKANRPALERFAKSGPDFERFLFDWSTTDDEFSNEEEGEDWDEEEPQQAPKDQYSTRLLRKDTHANDSDENSERSLDDNSSAISVADKLMMKRAMTDDDSPDLASFFEGEGRLSDLSEEARQDILATKGWKNPRLPIITSIHETFTKFMDREKSKAFKRAWHNGDLSPGASTHWKETRHLIKTVYRYNQARTPFKAFADLRLVDVHPQRHRRTYTDMAEARAAMTPFFPSNCPDLELDSPLLDQFTRSQQLSPQTRSHASNKYRLKEFWHELDALGLGGGFKAGGDKMPKWWDTATRPIIARLYKAGILDNAVMNNPQGQAIAAKEHSREDADLYIDYRDHIKDIHIPPDMEECPSPESILNTARTFAANNPTARFALLRLWSAPHFYPLMIGHSQRVWNSFADPLGRCWEWKFIPKDMPYSEWSMHHNSKQRLQPFRWLLRDRVVVSRNLFLVMADGEGELLKLATAVTFALQTEPWRLEVDLGDCFVNVDLGFLEGMRREWLE